MRAKPLFAAMAALLPGAALASETITYTYDSRGRLVEVAHAGGPADNQKSSYSFDKADNRTNYASTGNLGYVPGTEFSVVPLTNGAVVVLPQ